MARGSIGKHYEIARVQINKWQEVVEEDIWDNKSTSQERACGKNNVPRKFKTEVFKL